MGKDFNASIYETLAAIMPPYPLDNYGFHDLHKAVLGLKSIPVAEVLKKSPCRIDEGDFGGRTALSWAAQRRDYSVMKLLLRNKADIHKTDSQQRSPIFWAARGGSPQCVRLLLEHGADINQVDYCGSSLLHEVCYMPENTEFLDLVLQNQPKIDNQSGDGDTALLIALEDREFCMATKLIHYGANIHIKENSGHNALSVAVLYNEHPMIRLLLDRNADHQGTIKQHGTFLHLTAQIADVGTLKILTNPSSKLATRDIKIKNSQGRTALEAAKLRDDVTLEWRTAFRSFLWSVDAEKIRVSPFENTPPGDSGDGNSDNDSNGEEDVFVDALE